ncbi:MAG: hypothetical protein QM757_32180 [Paludibaculum sp.]
MASGDDAFVHADVQRITAAAFPTEDPDIASYSLRFDLRVKNLLRKSIFLPVPRVDEATDRVAALTTELQLPDEKWETLIHSSWYGTSQTKYEACMELQAGKTYVVEDVPSALVLLKSQVPRLGKEPTLRLKFYLLCQQANGQVLSTPVETEGFRVLLPPAR